MDSYKNKIVDKPWGYEYLIYENNLVALWLLHIKPNQKTSLHCHPKKTTGRVLLSDGSGAAGTSSARLGAADIPGFAWAGETCLFPFTPPTFVKPEVVQLLSLLITANNNVLYCFIKKNHV